MPLDQELARHGIHVLPGRRGHCVNGWKSGELVGFGAASGVPSSLSGKGGRVALEQTQRQLSDRGIGSRGVFVSSLQKIQEGTDKR